MHLVGVDLTASPKKATACAVLSEDGAWVGHGSCRTDDDIVAFVEEHRPCLVAVDAPLNLPLGLCCLEGTCPCQPLADGKGRQCERELSRLGIGCYYTTKRSIIKGVVYRAIGLCARLTEHGGSVIEIYPHASKVRLFGRLPPKATVEGRRALQAALIRLLPALPAPETALLDHDLLDALVAAYTGYLYCRGQTIALGDRQEGLLHIPVQRP